MSYISLNMNLSFSMFPTFNLSRRNKYPKYVLCFSLTSIWIKHLFAKMNSYIGNLSVESCTRSLAHANMKCSIGKELSIYITPPCATVLKKTTPLKVDLVWSNCRRFIYHKEMNTTNMTFTAPSLQLRSNTFFHSYEFEYRKPVLNRRSRSFFQTGTFSKKKALSIHPVLQRTTLFKYWGCKNGSLNDSVDVFAFLYANCSTQCSLAILKLFSESLFCFKDSAVLKMRLSLQFPFFIRLDKKTLLSAVLFPLFRLPLPYLLIKSFEIKIKTISQ